MNKNNIEELIKIVTEKCNGGLLIHINPHLSYCGDNKMVNFINDAITSHVIKNNKRIKYMMFKMKDNNSTVGIYIKPNVGIGYYILHYDIKQALKEANKFLDKYNSSKESSIEEPHIYDESTR